MDPDKNFYLVCLAHATYFSNFALQVRMTIVRGDGGGIVFRAESASLHLYNFEITRDGLFSLIVGHGSGPSKPLIFGPNTAIRTGLNQVNLLTVVVQGSQIYLYINKQYVDSVHDTSYSAGEIGVFAADNQSVTDVAFSDMQVWKL